MAAQYEQLFGSFPATQATNNASNGFAENAYGSFDSDFIASGWTPVASSMTVANTETTPSSRLAGEPAFCAGRHCCQWSDGNFVCNNHYPSAEDLDRHVAMDHAGKLPNGQPSGDYHCHWAGCSKTESFGNKPKLTRHIHSHTGHKPHKCPHPGCGKGFVTKEQLKNHQTTHTKTKEHICPECGKGFAVKTALTSHMNVHKGTKPYICDECGKGFADSSNLSKHKAIHKRAALKLSHTKRHSACTSCSSAVPSPAFFPTGMAGQSQFSPYASEFPTPSIEPLTGPAPDYCGMPCFDSHCTQPQRLPCRSASPCKSPPCSNRQCSVDPCNIPDCPQEFCDFDHCIQPPCDLQDCGEAHCDLTEHCNLDDHCNLEDQCNLTEHCDFADCQIPDCAPHDCTQPCDDHHFDCFGLSDDNTTLSTPSTRPSVPVHPGNGKDIHARDHPHALVPDPFSLDHGLSEGFKQLNDFIHDCGDFCACVDVPRQQK